jgi:murein DD-endopeptidase MepM/ murein hydrolase activator NlpD
MLKGIKRHRFVWAVGFSVFLLALVLWSLKQAPTELDSRDPASLMPSDSRPVTTYQLKSGETFHGFLLRAGFNNTEVPALLSLAQGQLNFSNLRSGQRIEVSSRDESLQSPIERIQLHTSELESWIWERSNESQSWSLRRHQETAEFRLLSYSGKVSSSLWNSARDAQMDPLLIAEMTEVFAWQIDFAREVRQGDKWRITVEQKLVRGRPVSYGRILAAEYNNAGNLYTALLFVNDGKEVGYFSPEGKSLKKIFLKSPIKFSRISSRFNRRRFHPVLRTYRPHLGVDYAAPHGTEVRAVGDGVISMAAWNGGGGRTVKIRHNSTYSTHYKHLSRFANGVRSGSRVRQGQVIGYVGSSGLSTGPHLHFEFWENNRYVDPLGKSFPVADPVPAALMSSFERKASILLESLPLWLDETSLSHQRVELTQNQSDKIYQEALN